MSPTKWKLVPNTVIDKDGKVLDMGLEKAEEKYQAGLDYIKRLKKDYPNLTWKQEGDYLLIETNG